MKNKVIVGTVGYLHPGKKFKIIKTESIYEEHTLEIDKQEKIAMNEAASFFIERFNKYIQESKEQNSVSTNIRKAGC